VSIHPFGDGNGRTARALATTELWRSGYDMRGFLSLEEHYTADLQAYYDNLQMGLAVNFYEGRHDPDHTRWLEFFIGTMAEAAEGLRRQAVSLYDAKHREPVPWERLRRVQQQLLTRLAVRGLTEHSEDFTFSPPDVAEWFGISVPTAREWLDRWREDGFVAPAKEGAQRIRRYALAEPWRAVLRSVYDKGGIKAV